MSAPYAIHKINLFWPEFKGNKFENVKLTNLEELLLRMVFALPNASIRGLAWTTCSSRVPVIPPSFGLS